MAHTPGRWKRAGTSVLTQDGGLIASVYDGRDYSAEVCGERQHKHETSAANAQLIESAPDMLEALHAALAAMRRVYDQTDCGHMVSDQIDYVVAALAKAEGKA